MTIRHAFLPALVGLAMMALPADSFAEAPQAWQLGLAEPATPVMREISDFHNMLLIIITGIVLFVTGLLAYVVIRFNARANPVPSSTTHHNLLEVLWTVVPVGILIVIAIPSFRLLYYMDRIETPEMTLKVTGYQWYWGYEYPDYEGISFDSRLVPDAEIDSAKGQVRLLSTDHPVVLPVDTNIQILVTAVDVIHSWAVPAFGVKEDAVPGRLNEAWIRIEKPGVYYGQCSEICGTGHAQMPIEIHAVSKEDFQAWIEKAKDEFSWVAPQPDIQFAQAESIAQ